MKNPAAGLLRLLTSLVDVMIRSLQPIESSDMMWFWFLLYLLSLIRPGHDLLCISIFVHLISLFSFCFLFLTTCLERLHVVESRGGDPGFGYFRLYGRFVSSFFSTFRQTKRVCTGTPWTLPTYRSCSCCSGPWPDPFAFSTIYLFLSITDFYYIS